MNESAVAAIWSSGAIRLLLADSGQRVQVLYPGRRATRAGCDFQDAVLMIGQRRVTGDVEIHVASRLWEGHGHQRNPYYAGIVLHVVLRENGGLPALTAGGRAIPTVVLSKTLEGSLDELEKIGRRLTPGCVYAAGKRRHPGLSGLLLDAGLSRFAARVGRCRKVVLREGPAQALYSAIARALGYALNAERMEELSRRVPLQRLQPLASEGLAAMQVVLLCAAGLLPSQRGMPEVDPYVVELERAYISEGANAPALRATDWKLLVRPANHPCRRLAALAALVYRYREEGFYAGLRRLLEVDSADMHLLKESLRVEAEGYWATRYDFGHTIRKQAALLGRSRVDQIIINAVLPGLAAAASLQGDRQAEYRLTSLYLGYGCLPDNEITRHMQDLLRLSEYEKRGACRQQGLLHLYHSFCRDKRCADCPVFRRRSPGWG